jgi:hypothetical protein
MTNIETCRQHPNVCPFPRQTKAAGSGTPFRTAPLAEHQQERDQYAKPKAAVTPVADHADIDDSDHVAHRTSLRPCKAYRASSSLPEKF